jgi:hypothetical protein
MRKRLTMAYLAVILALALMSVVPVQSEAGLLPFGTLRIYGSVNRPLNLSYNELLSFPMVSEVARLKCVAGLPDVTGNWTGIPLFYLLTMAEINSDAYKVVTYGSDGFSSDLLIQDALRPTTILALEDNGTTAASGILPMPRLIVPDNWGYKWVALVDAIEVVNYDYKGTYESGGYSDNGTIPGWTALPSITPPLQGLNFTFGNLRFNAPVFTSASIIAYALNYSQKQISLNVTVPSGKTSFADLMLPQDFLKSPYNVTIDNEATSIIEADLASQSYVYVSIPEGFHTVNIVGTQIFGFAPEININIPQNIYTGENAIFDASKSAAYGTIVAYEWNFGDGTNGTGAVVSHSYNKEGTYQLELKVIDNDGLSSSKTLTITVGSPPQYVPLAVRVLLAMLLALLIIMLAILLRNRKR